MTHTPQSPTFAAELKSALADIHMLEHPFYQAWSRGELTLDVLRDYAAQYFHHVRLFPRFISAVHAQCGDASARRVLLENLNEEEGMAAGHDDHPELWMQFAEGLGAERKRVADEALNEETAALIDAFRAAAARSYAAGLGALYAYEHQIPEIAEVKIDGLKKFYRVTDERSLKFFSVHAVADIEHREALEALLDALDEEDRTEAKAGARMVAEALWGFLDGVDRVSRLSPAGSALH